MIQAKPIGIASDHAGFAYKTLIKDTLVEMGLHVQDFGTDSEASTDYPDYIHPLAQSIETGVSDLGIAICGSANGVCMTANKHQGIRAAIAWNEELASLARQHNNANIICIPARFITEESARSIVRTFLQTEFEGGRHQRRVDKIKI